MSQVALESPPALLPEERAPGRLASVLRSPRWSASLVVGLLILLAVLIMSLVGAWLVDPNDGIVAAVTPSQRPSARYLLGTDSQGRDVLTSWCSAPPRRCGSA